MDFFSLRVGMDGTFSAEKFLDYICSAGRSVHKDGAGANLRYSVTGNTLTMTVQVSGRDTAKQKQSIIDDLALGMASFIIDVHETRLAVNIVSKRYSFSSREERLSVEQSFRNLLTGSEEGDIAARRRRMRGIVSALGEYLQDHDYLDLDGFISFRLADYMDELRETVDMAVEEYLLDRQYEEFIHLLQYFVHFQEPLTPLIHLMHKEDREFSILNEQFAKISTPPPGGVIAKIADQEMEMEDMVVSSLISLSPDRIIIHTLHPDAQIIATIRRIFGDRAELCLGCPHCRPFHQEARRRDQGT
ncbi:putative sporulation protein YtxC [Paenibacillus sp. M1]|uniref:Sporulation protein YtxC n=1 Tax=Paenibacillus haidiansis TaxID=1574488 RepID=A0ABU7VTR7_9BACL